jgi:hypothetical protein
MSHSTTIGQHLAELIDDMIVALLLSVDQQLWSTLLLTEPTTSL